MKVLVLTGSSRLNGNSSKLAEAFIEGAKEAGHDVKRIDCAHSKVGGCMGCGYCFGHDGVCCQKDDFVTIREELIAADAIVFASPVYYYGLSSQLRAVIDRFFAIDQQLHCAKHTALLLSLGDTEEKTAAPSLLHYRAFTGYLGWKDCGNVIAYGCMNLDDVKADDLSKARALGKAIAD